MAFAEQVLSQQGGVCLHAQGHVAVHGGLELDGKKHGGPGRTSGGGPAGDAPGHVGPAPAEPWADVGGGEAMQGARVELGGERFGQQAQECADHGGEGEGELVEGVHGQSMAARGGCAIGRRGDDV